MSDAMSVDELDDRCLEEFPNWLRSLGKDVEQVALVALSPDAEGPAARSLLAGVNYLFKSVELIPDGIEDLGYVDDAFVLRLAVDQALRAQSGLGDKDNTGTLSRLAGEVELVREFLGEELSGALGRYVASLTELRVRGRTPEEILADDAVSADVESEAKGFASQYEAPGFGREEKNLIKLRSFIGTKLKGLPRAAG